LLRPAPPTAADGMLREYTTHDAEKFVTDRFVAVMLRRSGICDAFVNAGRPRR
jgi:hypothetical protein